MKKASYLSTAVLTESSESWRENRAVDRNPDCKCNGDDVEGEKLLPNAFLSLRALPGMLTGAELPSIPTKNIPITIDYSKNTTDLKPQQDTNYTNM
jgi:hypothetical protein